MKNFVQPGKVLEYVNAGSALASGDVVEIPGIGCGVAAVAIANGASGAVNIDGVYEIKKPAGAIALGARLYFDNVTKEATTVVKPTLIGFAFKAALSGDAKVQALLIPMGDTDPGNLAQAAYVAPLGATANLVGVDGTGSNAAPLVGTEARLDAIEAKVDAALASLVAAGLMASS